MLAPTAYSIFGSVLLGCRVQRKGGPATPVSKQLVDAAVVVPSSTREAIALLPGRARQQKISNFSGSSVGMWPTTRKFGSSPPRKMIEPSGQSGRPSSTGPSGVPPEVTRAKVGIGRGVRLARNRDDPAAPLSVRVEEMAERWKVLVIHVPSEERIGVVPLAFLDDEHKPVSQAEHRRQHDFHRRMHGSGRARTGRVMRRESLRAFIEHANLDDPPRLLVDPRITSRAVSALGSAAR